MSSARKSNQQTMAPETLQPLCFWTITPLFTITVGTTLIRMYIRYFIKSFGWDDWAAATLLPLNAGLQAILYVFLKFGAGLHITQVQVEQPESLFKLLKGLFAIEIYYVWMHFHLKMGFLLFYLRLSHLRSFRIVVYVTMAFNGLLTVGVWLLYFLQCAPLEAFWNPMKYPKPNCLHTSITYFVPYSAILVLDVAILILPIQTVWNLQMTLRRRLAVLGVICTGGAAVLISALRIMVLLEFAASPDFTWTLGKMIIVSAFEINIAIIASNMPSIKALWLNWQGGTLNGSQRSKYSQHHQLSDLPSGQDSSIPRRLNPAADNVSEQSLVTKEGSHLVVTNAFSQEEEHQSSVHYSWASQGV